MEGVTDEAYRNVITTLYPEWDYICTDFLRIPTTGSYPDKHLVKHYGRKKYTQTPELKTKNHTNQNPY